MRLKPKPILLVASVAALATAYAAQNLSQVVIDGQSVSLNGRNIDGRLYIPVRDLADSLGYSVQSQGGRTELIRTPTSTFVRANSLADGSSQGTAAQGLAIGSGATSPTIQTAASLTQTSSVPTPRAELTGTMGSDASFEGFAHRVVSIEDAGREYPQQFDQRRQRLRAPFEGEKLVVIRMSVTNSGSDTVRAPIPSTFGATVFDDQKVGYPITAVDIRQPSDVVTSDTAYRSNLMAFSPPLLAPGGSFEYAVVASVPADRSVNQVVFNVPPSRTRSQVPSMGATVTINRAASE